jgi:predicted ATPase
VLHRLEGGLLLRGDARDATAAESSFWRSIEIARNQGAKSWELRATMSMVRLWRLQGKVQQARDLLVPVYGWSLKGSTRAI